MRQVRMLMRGLVRRCPRCGSSGIFSSWFGLRDVCPRCGLQIEREDGYWVGAMTISVVSTMLLFVVLMAVAVIWTWPNLPVVELIAGGVVGSIVFPIVTYPICKSLWLATDLAFFHVEAGKLPSSAE
ncbi:MAG: hypothetical protein DCC58_02925 [Chloroflexi bacterium]|nr:MAG: hypothetical protein DCC58_02925 [Chloroflexota bacterium]